VWGSAVSSPAGVWGGAPADKRFKNLTSGGNNFNNFPENQLTKFCAFYDLQVMATLGMMYHTLLDGV